MSFEKFKKYLNEGLASPNNLTTDWRTIDLNVLHKPTTLKWASTDSEDLFNSAVEGGVDTINKTINNNISQGIFDTTIKYYLDNPITYNLNSYGFRSDEFSMEESGNVFLGCSDTFGVGHRLEHSWPYLLTKIKFPNHKIYNLGAPGSGSDTHFRLMNGLKNKMKIKNIFHWLPIRTRFEIFMEGKGENIRNGLVSVRPGFSTISPIWELDNNLFSPDYIKKSLLSDTVRNINDLKNILAIKNIADELGVHYYLANFEQYISSFTNIHQIQVLEYLKKTDTPTPLLARDFQHMSIFDSVKVTASFLKEIEDVSDINII